MKLQRYFLGWQNQLVTEAVECLTRDWEADNLDLRNRLIITPTRTASRRLREKLAETVAAKYASVLPGLIVTPEYLLEDQTNQYNPAPDTVSVAVWSAVLRENDLSQFPNLFPDTDSMPCDTQFILSTAENITELKYELGGNGYSLASAANQLTDSPETERWNDLARLEEQYLTKIESLGLNDNQTVKQSIAAHPALPSHVEQVDVFGVPDPLPLAWKALTEIAEIRHAAYPPTEPFGVLHELPLRLELVGLIVLGKEFFGILPVHNKALKRLVRSDAFGHGTFYGF